MRPLTSASLAASAVFVSLLAPTVARAQDAAKKDEAAVAPPATTPVADAPATPPAPSVPPPPDPAQVRPSGPPLASDVTRNGDFMDTRLTWTFGDDDFTKPTGEAFPLSPKASVGDRPQYRLFFDNLNSRFAGRENLSHLVLYKKMPGYVENLDTEAAIVLRVDMSQLATRTNNVNNALYDAGSYIRMFYKTGTGESGRPSGVDLIFFPLDTDRFRLGYLYDISWGGTAQSINQSIFPRLAGSAPGAKFQYTSDKFYGFVGFKTAYIVEPQKKLTDSQDIEFTRVQEANYGFLMGGGVDFTDNVRADVGAGYFQQGRFEQPDVQGERVYTYGASGRLVLHDKMPVPASVDFALYRNDPNAPMVIFRPETYTPGRFSWAVTAEGTHLWQNLKDFDRPGATKLQGATAGALQGTVKAGFSRVQITGIFRDLAYVMRNQPGYIPFESMPSKAQLQPEAFFALAYDYYIEGLRLTPGVGGGLQLPATFSSDQVDKFGQDIGRTTVIRSQGNLSPLPEGKHRVPIIQARASIKWDISPILAAVVWGQIVHDNNATRLERASDGTTLLRQFISPDFIGAGTSLQARF